MGNRLIQIYLQKQLLNGNNKRFIFHGLPGPNRGWLLVVYVFMPNFLIQNNLCDVIYQILIRTYQSLTAVVK